MCAWATVSAAWTAPSHLGDAPLTLGAAALQRPRARVEACATWPLVYARATEATWVRRAARVLRSTPS